MKEPDTNIISYDIKVARITETFLMAIGAYSGFHLKIAIKK
jgi:hypothetical protein